MRQSFKELKDNLLYLLKLVWGYDKSLFAVFAAFSISGAALSYIEIYVPKILLGSLIRESPMDRLLVQVGLLSLAILAVSLVKSWTGNRYQCKCGLVRSDLCLNLLTVKRFRIRYRYMEDPKTADSLERAKYISWSSNVGIEAALNNLQAFARGAILLAGVIAVCASLNPAIPLTLIAAAVVNLLLGNASKKRDVEIWERNASLDREIEYLSGNMGEPDVGKDVRVYGLKEWWLGKYAACLGMRLKNEAESQKTLTGMRQMATLLAMAADAVVYICLIGEVLSGGDQHRRLSPLSRSGCHAERGFPGDDRQRHEYCAIFQMHLGLPEGHGAAGGVPGAGRGIFHERDAGARGTGGGAALDPL